MNDNLQNLDKYLKEELELLEYPPGPWLEPAPPNVLHVAIIGGGMAGLIAAFALMQEGIYNIQIFDASPKGYEGPWATCARMLTLRSGKNLVGPALNIPGLTFRAWYIAQFGEQEWESLYKIPTIMWMDYLRWYKTVLNIPVQNDFFVSGIEPKDNLIQLSFSNQKPVLAQKVILATGRGGFGGPRIPDFLKNIPKNYYVHTSGQIDCSSFQNKNVIVIGTGASAFDAAAAALENGAVTVTMLSRRNAIPDINKFSSAFYPGFNIGYSRLPDEAKIKIMEHVRGLGTPPPFESMDRVKNYPNFKVITGIKIDRVQLDGNRIKFLTNKESLQCDFIVAGTGYEANGKNLPELARIVDDILLWGDRYPNVQKGLGSQPYLGDHFQFMEKEAGKASYLKHIYCFNNAAKFSHGLTSGDIPAISVGAANLARGIVADFFTQNWPVYVKRLESFVTPEFLDKDYPFIN